MQHALGYSLTGSVDEHCFFILYGTGRNGKGTLCETIKDILGSYAGTTDIEAFLSTDKTNVTSMAAVGDLKGLRFALGSEINSNRRLDEAFIKRTTGGDTRRGARLHANAYEYKPTDKLWFLTNHLPSIKDATAGMWERVRAIPFTKSFDGKDKDPQLRDKLLAERDGIFTWCVEGAHKYLAAGRLPPIPKAVMEANSDYRDENDILSKFISDRMERSPDGKVGVADVHKAYEVWCRDHSIDDPTPLKFFRKNMNERGVKTKEVRGSQQVLGYRLRGMQAASKAGWADDPLEWATEPRCEGLKELVRF